MVSNSTWPLCRGSESWGHYSIGPCPQTNDVTLRMLHSFLCQLQILETLQLFLLQNRVYSVARGAVHGAYVKQRAVLETSCTWWHCPEQPLPIGLMSKHHQLFVLENAKVKRKEKHRAASTGGISPLHNNAFWSDFHLMQLLVCLYVWSEQPNPIGLM